MGSSQPLNSIPTATSIEFILICAINILFTFLTLNTFSLVIKSCSSDSQVVETGNERLSAEGSFLHSGD